MMAWALAQGPFGVMNKLFSESDIIAAVNFFCELPVNNLSKFYAVVMVVWIV